MTRLIAAFAVLALTLLSAIPQGWMTTSVGGKMLLVICTGDGPVEMLVDVGDHDPASEEPQDHGPCAFAGLGDVADRPQYALLKLQNTGVTQRWDHLDFTHASAGFHRRYDARGPPQYS